MCVCVYIVCVGVCRGVMRRRKGAERSRGRCRHRGLGYTYVENGVSGVALSDPVVVPRLTPLPLPRLLRARLSAAAGEEVVELKADLGGADRVQEEAPPAFPVVVPPAPLIPLIPPTRREADGDFILRLAAEVRAASERARRMRCFCCQATPMFSSGVLTRFSRMSALHSLGATAVTAMQRRSYAATEWVWTTTLDAVEKRTLFPVST